MKDKRIKLDLNNPKDARRFLLEALPKALPSAATHAILEDGSKVEFKKLNDSQAVQYAWELLPIYNAAFPDLVDITEAH